MVPLPGSAMPTTSARQFMELAVNMPEQEPQVGQALHSMAVRLGVVERAGLHLADGLEHAVEVDRAAVEAAGQHGPAARP